LKEVDYDDLVEGPADTTKSVGGWIGITDKYWLTALIPDQKAPFTGTFRYSEINKEDTYQTDIMTQAPQVIVPGATAQIVNHVFAGAKEVHLLDRYEEQLGIARFDLAVDFGWFYFMTKPLFFVLDYFFKLLGNFGLAILLLTVCVKAIFFPLANKSYKSMSKMKALQPEMTKLRERFGDDRSKMNQEMMALYKKEKVNPASGCLPIMVQIPVFFALYKVMFVTIEMRHQPFFGWIHDLSAPDPIYIHAVWHHSLGCAAIPDDRDLAGLYGCIHVCAAIAEPPAGRSGAGENFPLYAVILHLLVGQFPRRPGDLLDLEQSAFGHPAMGHHEADGRSNFA
jgi:YidC/Oxa1 family membrane protein insertase